MYRPPSTNIDGGCTKQSNNGCPMEAIGQQRRRDLGEEFQLVEVGLLWWSGNGKFDFFIIVRPDLVNSPPCLPPGVSLSLALVNFDYHSNVSNMQRYCSCIDIPLKWRWWRWGIGENERAWIGALHPRLCVLTASTWTRGQQWSPRLIPYLVPNDLSVPYQPSFPFFTPCFDHRISPNRLTLERSHPELHCECLWNTQHHLLWIYSSRLPHICGEINHSHHCCQFTSGEHQPAHHSHTVEHRLFPTAHHYTLWGNKYLLWSTPSPVNPCWLFFFPVWGMLCSKHHYLTLQTPLDSSACIKYSVDLMKNWVPHWSLWVFSRWPHYTVIFFLEE